MNFCQFDKRIANAIAEACFTIFAIFVTREWSLLFWGFARPVS